MGQKSQFGTDWQDQWERVKRLHARTREISLGLSPAMILGRQTESRDDRIDDMLSFFMHCHHLSDWLIGSDHRTEHEVHTFIGSHYELQLCADLCSGIKHYRVKKAWASETVTTTAKARARGSGVAQPWPGEQWVVPLARGDIDVFRLADRCVELWEAFIA